MTQRNVMQHAPNFNIPNSIEIPVSTGSFNKHFYKDFRFQYFIFNFKRGCPRGVMVKAMDCGIVVRELVRQSRYYVHFRANTLGKGMNSLIVPPMG